MGLFEPILCPPLQCEGPALLRIQEASFVVMGGLTPTWLSTLWSITNALYICAL